MRYNGEMVMNFRRQLWVSSLIIVASVVVFLVGFSILTGDIAAKADKISMDRGLIDKQTGMLAVLAGLKEQAPQAAAYQSAMNALLPTQDELIGFGSWLSQAASANHVSTNFSFENAIVPASDVAFGRTNFSFTATGDDLALAAFLSDIEKTDPGFFVTINSFDMVNTNGSYQLSGEGTAFFRQ